MPFLTDTHVHFDLSAATTAACVQRALEAGVTRLMAVGGSAELNASALAAARAFPGSVRLALGWDRDQAGRLDSGTVERWDGLTVSPSYRPTVQPSNRPTVSPADRLTVPSDTPLAAIGEIGLDYHYHHETREAQCELFGSMLRLAAERDLPAIIHTREADDDTLRVLAACGSRSRGEDGRLGVVHCFTGGPEFARALLARGLYLSFSGIVTFRNADLLREVARQVPADRLLLETDSPFLAPVPKRGQRNEPAFVVHVAELLATLRGVTLAELADQTNRNAARLFGAWA
ncbi:MAG: TatD family hydrolase [Kiritimatiellia bacterium]